ncbi:MAG: stage V sporulation protein S [Clostridia bacterium]|nr:stage V sporulation protein S [Clostridia bacterium]
MNNETILKISSKSNPSSVAGAIVGVFNENKKSRVELQAVGAGAVNQAVKAIAIARGFVASTGVDLVCIPAFNTIKIENEDRTAMKFIVRGIN